MSSSSSSSFPILVPSPSANGSRHDAPDPAAVAVLPAIPGALAFGEGGERGGDNVDALSRVRDLEDWMSAEATKLLGEPYTATLSRDADSSASSSVWSTSDSEVGSDRESKLEESLQSLPSLPSDSSEVSDNGDFLVTPSPPGTFFPLSPPSPPGAAGSRAGWPRRSFWQADVGSEKTVVRWSRIVRGAA